jgi:hypothetical protein
MSIVAFFPLTLTLSRGEREKPSVLIRSLIDCPANSVLRFFKQAGYNSPSPWGEGRGEGEQN